MGSNQITIKNKIMPQENLFAGDCIRTFTGKYVNVFDPDPNTLVIEDIAHALSMQCRFGGHLPYFYSVAQHCVTCSTATEAEAPDPNLAFTALMHDSSEAYLLDIPRPIKLKLANYKEIEDKLMKALSLKFGFTYPLPEMVHTIDNVAIVSEWNAIMLPTEKLVHGLSNSEARNRFLERYLELKNRL